MQLPQTNALSSLSDKDFNKLFLDVTTLQEQDRQQAQLLYYKSVSKTAKQIHTSNATTIAVFGGNGSSKTESCLVEMMICATGIVPESLQDCFDRSKLRGPINCRVVCESLTTVLHPIILPKLQWWNWDGDSQPGGEKGHWGWIPKSSLINSTWDKSWSEKLRMLKVKYWDEKRGKYWGQSTIQFMSVDQDPSDFASGNFHIIIHDEPPSYAIWRENQARAMRVSGRMLLAMTWPDDPSIAVDWIFDEVYDPGSPGPNKNPDIDWINLYTTDNPHLNQTSVAKTSAQWSDEIRDVRVFGQPIRFSNRIHPLFTDSPKTWCYACEKTTVPVEGNCSSCGGGGLSDYCHVTEDPPSPTWPTIFVIDPHSRKPHMMIWVQVDPYDDLWQVAEADIDGDCTDVKMAADNIEQELSLNVVKLLMDPNMGAQPAGAKRGVTWRDEFDNAGLYCDSADNCDVGRQRINEYLKAERTREQPRMHIHASCKNTIYQFKRYVWDDHRQKLEKALKQKPKEKYDDYPTMWKYLLNDDPAFNFLTVGAPVIKRFAGRKY